MMTALQMLVLALLSVSLVITAVAARSAVGEVRRQVIYSSARRRLRELTHQRRARERRRLARCFAALGVDLAWEEDAQHLGPGRG